MQLSPSDIEARLNAARQERANLKKQMTIVNRKIYDLHRMKVQSKRTPSYRPVNQTSILDENQVVGS